MIQCLSSSRFNMWCDILRQFDTAQPMPDPNTGESTVGQDRLTGQITHNWVEDYDVITTGIQTLTIPCLAKAIVTSGLRSGNENWGDIYQAIEFVRIWYPATYVITQRDRVTNIRTASGEILWKEEEADPTDDGFKSTVFDVVGVIPKTDPFGSHNENEAVLERIQDQ